jgi:hypothetical protein
MEAVRRRCAENGEGAESSVADPSAANATPAQTAPAHPSFPPVSPHAHHQRTAALLRPQNHTEHPFQNHTQHPVQTPYVMASALLPTSSHALHSLPLPELDLTSDERHGLHQDELNEVAGELVVPLTPILNQQSLHVIPRHQLFSCAGAIALSTQPPLISKCASLSCTQPSSQLLLVSSRAEPNSHLNFSPVPPHFPPRSHHLCR